MTDFSRDLEAHRLPEAPLERKRITSLRKAQDFFTTLNESDPNYRIKLEYLQEELNEIKRGNEDKLSKFKKQVGERLKGLQGENVSDSEQSAETEVAKEADIEINPETEEEIKKYYDRQMSSLEAQIAALKKDDFDNYYQLLDEMNAFDAIDPGNPISDLETGQYERMIEKYDVPYAEKLEEAQAEEELANIRKEKFYANGMDSEQQEEIVEEQDVQALLAIARDAEKSSQERKDAIYQGLEILEKQHQEATDEKIKEDIRNQIKRFHDINTGLNQQKKSADERQERPKEKRIPAPNKESRPKDIPQKKSGGEIFKIQTADGEKEIRLKWDRLVMAAKKGGMRDDEIKGLTPLELYKKIDERDVESYQTLRQLSSLGMSYEDMKRFVERPPENRPRYIPEKVRSVDLKKSFKYFWADVRNTEGKHIHPLAEKFGEVIKGMIIEAEQRKKTPQEAKKEDAESTNEARLIKAFRKILGENIATSVKEDSHGHFIRGVTGQDADVKISLFLLKTAGFSNLENITRLKQGAIREGMFVVDAGEQVTGFRVKKTEGSKETRSKITTTVNNHSENRQFPTSSAQILFEGMKHAGLFKDIKKTEGFRWVAEMMVRLTVDEDNASFPSHKNLDLNNFKNSDKTLMGLAYAMTAEQIQDYLGTYVRNLENQGPLSNENFNYHYTNAVMRTEFTEDQLKKYKLNTERRRIRDNTKLLTRQESRRMSISQAEKVLARPEKEMRENGEVLDTQYGKYFVRIIREPHDKLLAGYQAVKAHGYRGFISYDITDPERPNYLLNTLDDNVDLSDNKKLMGLRDAGGVMVRGAMFLKDRNRDINKVGLSDLLEAVTGKKFSAKGQLKEFLTEERENTKHPMPILEMPEESPAGMKGWEELFKRVRYKVWKGIKAQDPENAEEVFRQWGNEISLQAYGQLLNEVGEKKLELTLFKTHFN